MKRAVFVAALVLLLGLSVTPADIAGCTTQVWCEYHNKWAVFDEYEIHNGACWCFYTHDDCRIREKIC